jgi:hypothetical protein
MDTDWIHDTDWINQELRLSNINQLCFPEKLSYITLEFIYVNRNSEVFKTLTKNITLSQVGLSKERLISIIHNHKESNALHNYILKDTLMFHIPIEPEVLPAFLEDTFNCSTFMKPLPHIVEDIDIAPSIFIFHPVNTLFFIYHEQEKLAVKLKSALKNNDNSSRITKRVVIKLPTTTTSTNTTKRTRPPLYTL